MGMATGAWGIVFQPCLCSSSALRQYSPATIHHDNHQAIAAFSASVKLYLLLNDAFDNFTSYETHFNPVSSGQWAMAQKAAKLLAARNTHILNRTHLISLAVHGTFLLLRLLLFRSSATRSTWITYILLSSPGWVIELWFERIGRPSTTGGGRSTGEDLEARGLTEYLWDVLYWTWGCVVGAAVLGDWVWWCWSAVPVYSVYLAWKTYTGFKGGMGGIMMGQGQGSEESNGTGESKRQKKMEKRGQKVSYR